MKLTGTKKLISGIAVAAAIAVTGIIGFAQERTAQDQGGKAQGERGMKRGGHRGGHGMGRGFLHGRLAEKLNLSEAQKAQMTQIETRFRDSAKSMRGQSRSGKDNKFGTFDGTFNEAAVRAAAQERANRRVEMEVARARMMSELFAILTPEQKAIIAAQRQEMQQKHQERRARRGDGTVQSQ